MEEVQDEESKVHVHHRPNWQEGAWKYIVQGQPELHSRTWAAKTRLPSLQRWPSRMMCNFY